MVVGLVDVLDSVDPVPEILQLLKEYPVAMSEYVAVVVAPCAKLLAPNVTVPFPVGLTEELTV